MAFDRYARYYDLLNRGKDYASEVAYIERLMHRHGKRPKSILELGCGTGVHASVLAEKGYRVHGIDLSQQMLAVAEGRRQTLHADSEARLSYVRGDVRSYRIEECFDAVLSLFHVASYQVRDEDIAGLLETAARHLQDQGILIFDFWYGPAVLAERPSVRVRRLEDSAMRIARIAEPILYSNENRVDVAYDIFIADKATGKIEEISEIHGMRYFFLPEIVRLLREHGFNTWYAEEWMSGRPPGLDTWGVCVTAIK